MASPAQDIVDAARRLRQAPATLAPDEQAGVGATTGVLRNLPTATKAPLAPGMRVVNGTIQGPPPAPAPSATKGLMDRVAGALRRGSAPAEPASTTSLLRNPLALGAGGTALAATPEALRTGEVLVNPKASWTDVGTQAAEGVGRLGAAGSGAATGATLGAPLGPLGSLAGALAGGAFGYWAGDKAIRAGRSLAGVDPRSPAEQLGAPVVPMRAQSLMGEKATIPTAPPAAAPVAAPEAAKPFSDARFESQRAPVAAVPAAPAPNNILRDGNNYSGKDIKFGANIVGPDGKLINGGDPANPKGFGVTSLDTSEGHAANLRELARLRADNAAAAVPTGGVTDMGGHKGTTMMDDLVAKGRAGADLRGMSPRAQAHYLTQQAALDKQSQIAQMQNATALRGQDVGAATSRYGTDVGAATSRYGTDVGAGVTMRGQDLHLQGQMLPMQQQLRTMQMHQLASQLAGGDPLKAAQIKASWGLDSSHDLAVADKKFTQASAGTGTLDKRMEKRFQIGIGPNGEPIYDQGAAAKAASLAHQATGGRFGSMSPEEQAAHTESAVDYVRAVNGMNARRNDSWFSGVFSPPAPEKEALPDTSGDPNAYLRWGGLGDSLTPGSNTRRGDLVIGAHGRETPIAGGAATEPFIKQQLAKGLRWKD